MTTTQISSNSKQLWIVHKGYYDAWQTEYQKLEREQSKWYDRIKKGTEGVWNCSALVFPLTAVHLALDLPDASRKKLWAQKISKILTNLSKGSLVAGGACLLYSGVAAAAVFHYEKKMKFLKTVEPKMSNVD